MNEVGWELDVHRFVGDISYMRSISIALGIALVFVVGVMIGCTSFDQQETTEAGFAEVKPILEERCLGCHQGSVLGTPVPDFRTRDGMIRAGYVVPGEPDQSKLLEKVYLRGEEGSQMPPIGHGLSEDEMNLLGEWILQGADWPAGEKLQPAVMSREF